LLSVLLLQLLYGIRSERQLTEGQKRKNDTHASTTDPDC
jgi:transposase